MTLLESIKARRDTAQDNYFSLCVRKRNEADESEKLKLQYQILKQSIINQYLDDLITELNKEELKSDLKKAS